MYMNLPHFRWASTHLRIFFSASLFWLAMTSALWAHNEPRVVRVLRTPDPVKLDGVLEESVWQRTVPATDFMQWFPSDTMPGINQTEVHMAYNDQYLYVAVVCHSTGSDFITSSLRRDYRASTGDNITLVFDPFLDQTNAVIFGINPFGVQREALISGGGKQREDFNTSWDNKWYAEAKIYPDKWIGEFAIPFKTLRFREGQNKWYFQCYRFDTQTNERTVWAPVPRNQIIMDRAYNGEMIWEEPLGKPGANISVIPYISGGLTQDFEDGDGQLKTTRGIGGDAKIALTPSLNLDLTFNPDFSQVEVDRQVTNLDRFEIFFPERRQFFLENSDLFALMGTERIRPFFSRRIGVAQDSTTGLNVQNPIYYGARLNGKLNNKWRLGILNMQTAPVEASNIPSVNYSMATIQRQVFSRSFISAFVVNNQQLRDREGKFSLQPEAYNRVAGIDYNLATPDNTWQGKVFLHKSFTNQNLNRSIAQGARLLYTKRKYQFGLEQQYVGSGFEAETGFVPRTGFYRFLPQAAYNFFSTDRGINFHGPGFMGDIIYDENFRKSDHKYSLTYQAWFVNTSRMTFALNHNYTRLLDEFYPTGSESWLLPEGGEYEYVDIEATFDSDNRKTLSFTGQLNAGQFFSGSRLGAQCSLMYRIQPYGILSADVSVNYIGTGGGNYEIISLIGPRIDLTFTRNLFFTTVIQYNSQLENINLNARFQWRFKPVSDFFLVYTDNYLTIPNGLWIRNRGIVAKLTYWLNV